MLKYSNFSINFVNSFGDLDSYPSGKIVNIFKNAGLDVSNSLNILKDLQYRFHYEDDVLYSQNDSGNLKKFVVVYYMTDKGVKFIPSIEWNWDPEVLPEFAREYLDKAEKFCKLVNSYSSDYGL